MTQEKTQEDCDENACLAAMDAAPIDHSFGPECGAFQKGFKAGVEYARKSFAPLLEALVKYWPQSCDICLCHQEKPRCDYCAVGFELAAYRGR